MKCFLHYEGKTRIDISLNSTQSSNVDSLPFTDPANLTCSIYTITQSERNNQTNIELDDKLENQPTSYQNNCQINLEFDLPSYNQIHSLKSSDMEQISEN